MKQLRRLGLFRSIAFTLALAIALGGVVSAAVGRALPTGNSDGSTNTLPSRAGRYLEAYTLDLGGGKTWWNADEGGYFCTYNVTDGTGIAGHAAPVQADLSTKPLLHMFNGSSTLRLYIDFVRIRMTAIGAGATTTDFTAWVDGNGSTSKTGGTGTVATVVNTLGGGSTDGDTVVTFGVVTASAPTSEKRVDHQRVRSVVPVVEDQYTFGFGNTGTAFASGLPTTGTNQAVIYTHMPPVVVPPLGNFKLSEWGASQSGAHSFEYEVCYARR